MQKTKHRYEISRNCTGDPFCYGDFRLHQVGRIHMHPKGRIAEHLQRDYYELTIAEDGKGWVYTDSVAVPIRKGDIYLSFAGDFHAIESDEEDPLKFGFITVSTSLPALSAPLEGIMAENHAANARLFSEKRVSDIAARILSELAEDTRSLSEKYVESLICELLILLIRAFERKTPPAAHGVGERELLSFRLMHYIDNHIYSLRSLTELAALTGYTYNYLSNVFRSTTGETLSHYYKTRRLEAAQLLLKEGTSVSEAASMLGYSSIYAFSNAFSHHFGISPTAARKTAFSVKNPENA